MQATDDRYSSSLKYFWKQWKSVKTDLVTRVSWNAKLFWWLPQETAVTEEIIALSVKII